MEYTLKIDIDLPRKEVVDLFRNPDNMKHWHSGLVSFEHIEGSPGKMGSRSKLVYVKGKKQLVVYETVSVSDLPEEYSVAYQNGSLETQTRNFFMELDANTTRLISEFKFQGSGIIMKSMVYVMPRVFRKQSWTQLESFKNFAEKWYSKSRNVA